MDLESEVSFIDCEVQKSEILIKKYYIYILLIFKFAPINNNGSIPPFTSVIYFKYSV